MYSYIEVINIKLFFLLVPNNYNIKIIVIYVFLIILKSVMIRINFIVCLIYK